MKRFKGTMALFPVALAAAFFAFPQTGAAIDYDDFGGENPCEPGLSPIQIITRDAKGNLLPDINYVVYHQNTDADGNPYLSTQSLATGRTDSHGQTAVICVDSDASPYAVKLYDYHATYGYTTVFHADGIVEARLAGLRVILRDAEGNTIKNMKFDLYVQTLDVDGNPVVDETRLNQDKLIKSDLSTGEVGAVRTYLGPGQYVIRIHATGGKSYLYLWNQTVTEGQTTTLDYKLGTLRVVLEDGLGALVKNQKFSIYTQEFDARSQPILGTLVAQNLDTIEAGQADAYLPAGSYALSIPATNRGSVYTAFRLSVTAQQLTTFTYRLSGFRVILRDENGDLARNARFSIGKQKLDAGGKPVVDTVVLNGLDTGEAAYRDVYLLPGTYVLVYGDQRQYHLDVFENQFTTVDYPRNITIRPSSELLVSNPVANRNLSVRQRAKPVINGLKNFQKTVSKTYRVRASDIRRSFKATFSYTASKLRSKNVSAKKIRIAFYDEVTKEWSYVGTNIPSLKKAEVKLKHPGILILVAKK